MSAIVAKGPRCYDCRHVLLTRGHEPRCLRYSPVREYWEPVFGHRMETEWVDCVEARYFGECGEDGKGFEASYRKPPFNIWKPGTWL